MDIYQAETLEWRRSLETNLRKENSWLALAGLYWLEQGDNSFGCAPGNSLVFPADSGPDLIGTFLVQGQEVLLQIAEGLPVKVDGKIVSHAVLAPDTAGSPSEVTLGSLVWMLIKREDSLGIRLWDNSPRQRVSFPGRQWFPIQEDYRVPGSYHKHIMQLSIILQRKNAPEYEMLSGGKLSFLLHDQDCSLMVFEESEGELFTLFNDQTNGQETYSSGRYLVIDPPRDGKVILDFNRAYNPPCAFTPYATCPLPPSQNRLVIPIAAGEKKPLADK
jgi:uncharacterized protein (DUF1684 family)